MPLRYLLLVLDGRRPADVALANITERTGLLEAYRSSNLALLVNAPAEVIVLPAAGGLILGTLFHRHGYPERLRHLSASAAGKVTASGGRELVERYWGSYVAAIVSPDGATIVLRDPSGGLPCYQASFEGGIAFASDGPLLVDAALLSASIDWRMLGRALVFHHLPERDMAIAGMRQVFPGCAVSSRNGFEADLQLWSPWDHAWAGGNSVEESHKELLKRAVSMTIAAWRSCFRLPLVGLSGGLDSSIVAVCLAGGDVKPACVTLVTDNPLGDERRYAREVSGAIDAELLELRFDQAVIDFDVPVSGGIPVPCGKLHEHAYNSAIREAAAHFGADAFFAGAGGDNVFYITHSARPVVDRYDVHGLSSALAATLGDVAALTGSSLWTVAREAFRLAYARDYEIRWDLFADYIARDFVAAELAKPSTHPWLNPGRAVPLGKLGHVKLLIRAMNHIEHRDKTLAVPMICPLLSQPVVESCLAIPSWEYVRGGVDRSVARRAFASVLPPAIAARAGKGSPEGFVAQFIETHRVEITSRLLDGELARQGLLDRPALEQMLRARGRFGPSDCPRIMSLLDTEAWARHWSSRLTPL